MRKVESVQILQGNLPAKHPWKCFCKLKVFTQELSPKSDRRVGNGRAGGVQEWYRVLRLIFVLRQLTERMIEKDEKMYAVFVHL